MRRWTDRCLTLLALAAALACGAPSSTPPSGADTARADLPRGLLLALAVIDKGPEGKPLPQPAEVGILEHRGGRWSYSSFRDPASNVFHKAMVYEPAAGQAGILTLGGSRAIVAFWHPDGRREVLWEKDFGGRFSRMRDAEVGDLYGDGRATLAIATHDQGVVATVRPDGTGGWRVDELDHQENTIVHEIEIGDLDGDGVLEVYATPSAPNKLDGTPQPGAVVRYVPQRGEGRKVVADLGDRHAKEILVADVDGDGRDELYVSIEAVAGGQVEIQRFDAGTDPTAGRHIATLPDSLCRFLTAGDLDGDGRQEMVAAAIKSGLWLLRPPAGASGDWALTPLDPDSSGFEHAALATDLDGDGVDELYVASDGQKELRSYTWVDGAPQREVIYRHQGPASRLTWNIMPVPVALVPPSGQS